MGNGEVAVDDPASSTPKKAAKDTSRKRKTEESSPAPPAANQESPVCVKRAKTAKDNNRDLGLCRYAPRACSYSSSIKTSTCYPSVSLTLLQLLPSTVVTVSRRCFLFSSEHGSSVIFFCDQVLQIAPNKGGRNSKLPSGRKLLKATATPCPCLTTCVCVCSTGCFLLSWSGIRTRGRFSRQSTWNRSPATGRSSRNRWTSPPYVRSSWAASKFPPHVILGYTTAFDLNLTLFF